MMGGRLRKGPTIPNICWLSSHNNCRRRRQLIILTKMFKVNKTISSIGGEEKSYCQRLLKRIRSLLSWHNIIVHVIKSETPPLWRSWSCDKETGKPLHRQNPWLFLYEGVSFIEKFGFVWGFIWLPGKMPFPQLLNLHENIQWRNRMFHRCD